MTSFVNAIKTQEKQTTNGMKAYKGTGKYVLDMFYKIGAMRGKDPKSIFTAALTEDPELAVRVALWSRDVREGAGERELFRQMLQILEKDYPELALRVIKKVPELGRVDDLFVLKTKPLKEAAYTLIGDGLRSTNPGLYAKWMPREKSALSHIAKEMRVFFGMSPKEYRKKLVALTDVVENNMCANQWDDINFSQVPSKAATLYKKAFHRHTPKYKEYVDLLVKGDTSVKVNASAIYPHEVIKDIYSHHSIQPSETELNLITSQWEALPNYIGDSSVLALVDVSASMMCPAGNDKKITCMQVAVSLGLYVADKNKGPFKDAFLTFSSVPELIHVSGNIKQKLDQMTSSTWGMSTDIVKAFNKILKVAVKGRVHNKDMPKTLLILSDMQFDVCIKFNHSAMESLVAQYKAAGYDVPQVVFWNLNSHDNVPAKANDKGVALISGFSPSILSSVLSDSIENLTPEKIMLDTIMKERYNF